MFGTIYIPCQQSQTVEIPLIQVDATYFVEGIIADNFCTSFKDYPIPD